MKKPNTDKIIVEKSGIHGTGVFAKRDIKKGEQVIEYVGNKVTKKESDKIADEQIEKHNNDKTNEGAVYLFELNKRYDIDGNVSWNPAKYINHSCNPNCETDIIKNRIWIIAIKNIKKGEEISYNYGYDLDDFEEHPCNCGASNCVGFITSDDHWPKLEKLKKKLL